jgi:hypothetical protein
MCWGMGDLRFHVRYRGRGSVHVPTSTGSGRASTRLHLFFTSYHMYLSIIFLAVFGAALAVVGASMPQTCASESLRLLSHQLPLCLDGVDEGPEATAADFSWPAAPVCIAGGKEYCAHTVSNPRNRKGLGIIATQTATKAISKTFQSFTHVSPTWEHGLEVRSIPGRGKGVVATIPIAKGQRLLVDEARMVASARFPSHVSHSQGQTLFNTVLSRLPEADQNTILALDRSLSGSAMESVMKTNAFACQVSDAGTDDAYMCLFPSVARINHACRPNAHARFHPGTLSMEVKALAPIDAGEEITISYGKLDLSHAARQRLYQEGWNFTCTCALCKAPTAHIVSSDARRVRFQQLRDRLGSLTAETYDAQRIVDWEEEVVRISEAEGLELLLAEDYERMAYVYAGLGRMAEARTWASRARASLLDWEVVSGGPENHIKRVEDLVRELGGVV